MKYITCILPSKEAAISLVAYGSITLFGHEMALQAKRFTKSVSGTRFPQQNHTNTMGNSRIFAHQIGHTALSNQWISNSSITQHGNATSRIPYATTSQRGNATQHTAPTMNTTANIYNNGNTTSAINPGMVTLTMQGGFVPPHQHFSTASQNTHSSTPSAFNLGMVPSKMQGGVVPPYQHFSTNTTTQSGTTTVPPQHGPLQRNPVYPGASQHTTSSAHTMANPHGPLRTSNIGLTQGTQGSQLPISNRYYRLM